jgi:hypothetical protein
VVPALEVADIFRRHGEAFRQARAGHLGGIERRVMGAITACRTAVLGGHVEQCDDCGAPAPAGEIAFQNKSIVYAILFRTAAETLATIAANPRHLGAKLGMTMVLHTWGQTLQHYPHIHCVFAAGNAISPALPNRKPSHVISANSGASSGIPSIPALQINAIVPHSSPAPAVRTNKSPSARSHRASSNIDHQRAIATIPIVPNLPRLRSIRLL